MGYPKWSLIYKALNDFSVSYEIYLLRSSLPMLFSPRRNHSPAVADKTFSLHCLWACQNACVYIQDNSFLEFVQWLSSPLTFLKVSCGKQQDNTKQTTLRQPHLHLEA